MIAIFHKGITELRPRARRERYLKKGEFGLILHSGTEKCTAIKGKGMKLKPGRACRLPFI